jgi:hypothetical protein
MQVDLHMRLAMMACRLASAPMAGTSTRRDVDPSTLFHGLRLGSAPGAATPAPVRLTPLEVRHGIYVFCL